MLWRNDIDQLHSDLESVEYSFIAITSRLFGCFGFYGISTFVDYLMPNPFQNSFNGKKSFHFK